MEKMKRQYVAPWMYAKRVSPLALMENTIISIGDKGMFDAKRSFPHGFEEDAYDNSNDENHQ